LIQIHGLEAVWVLAMLLGSSTPDLKNPVHGIWKQKIVDGLKAWFTAKESDTWN